MHGSYVERKEIRRETNNCSSTNRSYEIMWHFTNWTESHTTADQFCVPFLFFCFHVMDVKERAGSLIMRSTFYINLYSWQLTDKNERRWYMHTHTHTYPYRRLILKRIRMIECKMRKIYCVHPFYTHRVASRSCNMTPKKVEAKHIHPDTEIERIRENE